MEISVRSMGRPRFSALGFYERALWRLFPHSDKRHLHGIICLASFAWPLALPRVWPRPLVLARSATRVNFCTHGLETCLKPRTRLTIAPHRQGSAMQTEVRQVAVGKTRGPVHP